MPSASLNNLSSFRSNQKTLYLLSNHTHEDQRLGSGLNRINPTKASMISPSAPTWNFSAQNLRRCNNWHAHGWQERFKCPNVKPVRGTDELRYSSTSYSPLKALEYQQASTGLTHEDGKRSLRSNCEIDKRSFYQVIAIAVESTGLNQKQFFKVVVKGSIESGTQPYFSGTIRNISCQESYSYP